MKIKHLKVGQRAGQGGTVRDRVSPKLTKSEHSEQVSFVERVRWAMPDVMLRLFAVPNGGHRHPKTAARLKAEGVTPGVPDIFVAIPTRTAHGLWIELKRSHGGALSAAQRDMISRLQAVGYAVVVAHGADAAWTGLCDYLGRDPATSRVTRC